VLPLEHECGCGPGKSAAYDDRIIIEFHCQIEKMDSLLWKGNYIPLRKCARLVIGLEKFAPLAIS